jgi:hypothetical protein
MTMLWLLTGTVSGALVVWAVGVCRWRREPPPPPAAPALAYELMLLRLGEARGRQAILDEVRMLEHGHLKTHVLAVQRCLILARDAPTPAQRSDWLTVGLHQTQRLLDLVVTLHQTAGSSALPSDLEHTMVDVAESLAVAYPRCGCQVEVAGQRPTSLDAALTRTLILVLYNALSNAYRHGHPTQIAVQLQYAPDALILVVHDDGQGIASLDAAHQGRGLRDMRELVAAHGGSLRITSSPVVGTHVRVTLPLPADQGAAWPDQDGAHLALSQWPDADDAHQTLPLPTQSAAAWPDPANPRMTSRRPITRGHG